MVAAACCSLLLHNDAVEAETLMLNYSTRTILLAAIVREMFDIQDPGGKEMREIVSKNRNSRCWNQMENKDECLDVLKKSDPD